MRRFMEGAAVLLVGLTAACASAGGTEMAGEADDRPRDAYVMVENNHWQDVVVYAQRLGARQRLGMVTSMSRGRLRLPARFVGGNDIELVADPIGGGAAWTSGRVRVHGGEAVRMDVENSLSLSSLAVWRPARLPGQ